MISQDNFIALLESLCFAKNQSIYSKTIGETSLSVDVTKQILHYPESDGLVVNEHQICNFSAHENFVVFECVHCLLEKGYKPEHIELEPKWKLGRGASGGRADILVKDNFGNPMRFIRAKTANFLPEYLFALLNRKSVRLAAEKVMTGASGHRRVPASFYENFAVPALIERATEMRRQGRGPGKTDRRCPDCHRRRPRPPKGGDEQVSVRAA